MAINLESDLEREIELKAKQRGYSTVEDCLRDLIRQDRYQSDASVGESSPGERFVQRLRGTGRSKLTTEQTMDLTRSGV